MSARSIVNLFYPLQTKLVGRVACFTCLVGFSPSGVFQILHSAFCTFTKTDFNSMFFHDICFCNVVPIDFVRGVLQPSLQHVEDSHLQALIQVLLAVPLESKSVNTTNNYERGFNAWRKWALQFKKIVIFPASSVNDRVFTSGFQVTWQGKSRSPVKTVAFQLT